LPGAVAQVFDERIRAAMPLAAEKILHRIRETRGGERLYDPRFHARQRGQGGYADALAALFAATCTRLGLDRRGEAHDDDGGVDDTSHGASTFRRPPRGGQMSLF